MSLPRLLAHERDAAIARAEAAEARAEAAEARVKDAEAHLDDAAHLIASVWDVVGRAEELTTPAEGARVLLTRAETAEARVRELTRERDEALKALETTTVAVALANRVGMSDHAAAQHHWLEAHKATERAEAAEARVRLHAARQVQAEALRRAAKRVALLVWCESCGVIEDADGSHDDAGHLVRDASPDDVASWLRAEAKRIEGGGT